MIAAGAFPRAEIVTGERLQSLTDISVVPRHVREFHQNLDRHVDAIETFEAYEDLSAEALERIARSRVIFVYTHEFDAFAEHIWPHMDGGPYVLMTHNSDYGVDAARAAFLDRAGDRVVRWYAQNAEVTHPKLVPMPIGLANGMWKHGNVRALSRASGRARRPKTELVFLHFNPKTYPARESAWETLRRAFPSLAAEPPPSRGFRRYLADLGRHRFCVAPRGNGADTHRLWECLYLGVVPITERSVHTEAWEAQGLPVLLVDDWSEVTPERLEHERDRFAHAPPPMGQPALRLSHYAELIARDRGAS